MSDSSKREILKSKIEAAEMRNALRSANQHVHDAAETATNFVKQHPFASLAGVAVIGLAIGAMTQTGRNAGRKAGANAGQFASYAAEMGSAYASGLIASLGEAVIQGKDAAADIGDAAADSAGSLKRKAVFTGGNAAAAAKALSRDAGKKAGRSLRDLRTAAKK